MEPNWHHSLSINRKTSFWQSTPEKSSWIINIWDFQITITLCQPLPMVTWNSWTNYLLLKYRHQICMRTPSLPRRPLQLDLHLIFQPEVLISTRAWTSKNKIMKQCHAPEHVFITCERQVFPMFFCGKRFEWYQMRGLLMMWAQSQGYNWIYWLTLMSTHWIIDKSLSAVFSQDRPLKCLSPATPNPCLLHIWDALKTRFASGNGPFANSVALEKETSSP